MGLSTSKVWMPQGAEELRVESGGKITSGGVQASASADLTHSVGTADGTVDDVGASFNQTTLNNNFKECTAKINALLTALRGVGIIAP